MEMGVEGDPAEQLARDYEHRVGFFARKVARTYMMGDRWQDELVSAGYWGLAKAVRNRRAEASEPEFSAYVSTRILGAVIDEARACLNRSSELATASLGPVGEDEDASAAANSWEHPGESPEELAGQARGRVRIGEALAVLEPAQRRVVEAYMRGDSIRELAERHGVAIGTMRVRFEKIARVLRGRAPHIRSVLREVA